TLPGAAVHQRGLVVALRQRQVQVHVGRDAGQVDHLVVEDLEELQATADRGEGEAGAVGPVVIDGQVEQVAAADAEGVAAPARLEQDGALDGDGAAAQVDRQAVRGAAAGDGVVGDRAQRPVVHEHAVVQQVQVAAAGEQREGVG